jgi:hypothetical protein
MIHLHIQLNGARVTGGQQEGEVVSIEVTDYNNPPVFMLTDPQTDKVDTYFLTYKHGRWLILDFSEMTDKPD